MVAERSYSAGVLVVAVVADSVAVVAVLVVAVLVAARGNKKPVLCD